jgi:hypothetical protein
MEDQEVRLQEPHFVCSVFQKTHGSTPGDVAVFRSMPTTRPYPGLRAVAT